MNDMPDRESPIVTELQTEVSRLQAEVSRLQAEVSDLRSPSGGWRTPMISTVVTRWAIATLALLTVWWFAQNHIFVRDTNPKEVRPMGAVVESTNGAVYRVWFGTNRRPTDAADSSKGFTSDVDEQTHFGHVDVNVPQTHRFGETGSNFFVRLLRRNLQDDHLSVNCIDFLEQAQMWSEIHDEMERAREAGDSAYGLIYLHGYNTSFPDAAIRAAQIGFDLKVTGATAFFSWPSLGITSAYTADEDAIQVSEAAIAGFITDFVKQSGAEKVHLIAHSMGNRGLLRALQRIATDAESKGGVRFGQIFLAAPDVPRRLFLNLANIYPQCSDRTTLYASNGDSALYLSSLIHNAPRAGYFLPYTVAPGIDTIAVPFFNVDLLGHSYFASAEALLHDMHDLIQTNAPTRSRQRMYPLRNGSESLWQLRR